VGNRRRGGGSEKEIRRVKVGGRGEGVGGREKEGGARREKVEKSGREVGGGGKT